MQPIFFTAALWLGLAVLAAIIAYYLDISITLMEICVGIAAGAIAIGFAAPFIGACFINGLGTLAYWSGSEAVLSAYIVGIVLAGFASVEEQWIRRLRTLTTGFLTPFSFIRTGSFVYLPTLIAAPAVFIILIASIPVTSERRTT